MKMTFNNTKIFLEPEDSGQKPLPDGYTLTFKIPPQAGRKALSKIEVKKLQTDGQVAVLS